MRPTRRRRATQANSLTATLARDNGCGRVDAPACRRPRRRGHGTPPQIGRCDPTKPQLVVAPPEDVKHKNKPPCVRCLVLGYANLHEASSEAARFRSTSLQSVPPNLPAGVQPSRLVRCPTVMVASRRMRILPELCYPRKSCMLVEISTPRTLSSTALSGYPD